MPRPFSYQLIFIPAITYESARIQINQYKNRNIHTWPVRNRNIESRLIFLTVTDTGSPLSLSSLVLVSVSLTRVLGEGGGVFCPTEVTIPAPASSASPCNGLLNIITIQRFGLFATVTWMCQRFGLFTTVGTFVIKSRLKWQRFDFKSTGLNLTTEGLISCIHFWWLLRFQKKIKTFIRDWTKSYGEEDWLIDSTLSIPHSLQDWLSTETNFTFSTRSIPFFFKKSTFNKQDRSMTLTILYKPSSNRKK